MVPASTERETNQDQLQKACNRRLNAEIELQSLEGDVRRARTRLLSVDDHSLYIDRPTSGGIPLELGSELAVVVRFVLRGVRFSFRTPLLGECQVPLGQGETMPGFALHRPQVISRDERRCDFRAPLGSSLEILAELTSPPASWVVVARLMDVSAGGLACLVLDSPSGLIECGEHYVVSFSLPDVSERFSFAVDLRHLRELPGAGLILGMSFAPSSDAAAMRSAVRQVSQFVARRLKKQRQEGAEPS